MTPGLKGCCVTQTYQIRIRSKEGGSLLLLPQASGEATLTSDVGAVGQLCRTASPENAASVRGSQLHHDFCLRRAARRRSPRTSAPPASCLPRRWRRRRRPSGSRALTSPPQSRWVSLEEFPFSSLNTLLRQWRRRVQLCTCERLIWWHAQHLASTAAAEAGVCCSQSRPSSSDMCQRERRGNLRHAAYH